MNLSAEISKIKWWHRINLNGIITPGESDTIGQLKRFKIPNDLRGKRVLDIGAWDGFFSFEAERRGAEVLSIDIDSAEGAWGGHGTGKSGFNLARDVLKSNVRDLTLSVYDLDPSKHGTFDLVLFLSVLYHLKHPLYALERVASVCEDMLILASRVDLCELDAPVMLFFWNGRHGDKTNIWYPNLECLKDLLLAVGFERIEVVLSPDRVAGEQSAVLHAWRRN